MQAQKSLTPGGIATTLGGDIILGELTVGGGPQKVTIHHFNPLGVHVGSFLDAVGFSGLQPPLAIFTDPLDHIATARVIFGFGGNSSSNATLRTLSGGPYRSVSASWTATSGSKAYFGPPVGDTSGRMVISAQISPACGICGPVPDPGVDFGNGPETGDLLLRYSAAGTYLGSLPNPGTSTTDATGDRYEEGKFQGSIDVGCGVLTGGPGLTTYLSRRDFNGGCIWSKTLPAGASAQVGADQNLELLFNTTGSIDLGAGPTPDFGGQNLTIARLDLGGNLIMSKTVGGPAASFSALSFDSDDTGLLLLKAKFTGSVDLGAGPLSNAAGDTFIASFDPTGTLRWSKVVNIGLPDMYGLGTWFRMVRQPCGMVIATTSATVDLGSGPIVPPQGNALSPNVGIAALGL
ncbi:MAG: hypothetical protein ABJE95_37900 [Byssovorax sp.]